MKSSSPEVVYPVSPGDWEGGPADEPERVILWPRPGPTLTFPEDIYNRPTWDRSLKTLPEMNCLLSPPDGGSETQGIVQLSGRLVSSSVAVYAVLQPLFRPEGHQPDHSLWAARVCTSAGPARHAGWLHLHYTLKSGFWNHRDGGSRSQQLPWRAGTQPFLLPGASPEPRFRNTALGRGGGVTLYRKNLLPPGPAGLPKG